jgi:hypothetical protein
MRDTIMSDNRLPTAVPLSSRSLIRRKRDEQVRRFARRLRQIAPHLNDLRFGPLVSSFARISILLERAYATLKDRDLISPETDELRTSIDTVSRLIGQQVKLAAALGLSPMTIRSLSREKVADAFDAARGVEDAEPEK